MCANEDIGFVECGSDCLHCNVTPTIKYSAFLQLTHHALQPQCTARTVCIMMLARSR